MIPFYDARRVLSERRADVLAAVERVVDSGTWILGPEVEAFEAEFTAWLGARNGIGCASGTDALILALRGLDIGPGDEVITVSNAGVPTVAAIRAVGALPRFVDVDPLRLLLDPRHLAAALTERSRAVLPVHLYGQPVDLAPILAFARRHELKVIEDCAQAHGARIGAAHVGTLGDAGCFSFYPTKNLAALGDGGFIVTEDTSLAERLRALRMYGFDSDRHAREEGLNSRLDELQAAILRARLRTLDAELEQRRCLARRYVEGLAGSPLRPLAGTGDPSHAHHLMVVQTPNRASTRSALDSAGIGSGVHYPTAVHQMSAYEFLNSPALPNTESACSRVLSLPLYPGLTPSEVDQVIEILHSASD